MHDDHEVNIHPFFEAIAEGEESKCRRIWQSVLLQQYLDAKGKFGTGPNQDRALAWFEAREGIGSGLYEVCFYAGLNFEKTRKRFAELLKSDAESFDFRTVKRDKDENQTVQNGRRYYRRKAKSEKLRKQLERKQVEKFLFPNAANENFPDYSNDNLPDSSNDHFYFQPTIEVMNDQ